MRVLILGGTVFLGRHLVDAALNRGDRVTLFHRGHHATHQPEHVEEVLGDRANDLDLLSGRPFDAVVDTSGYLPAQVADSAARFPGAHYTFVSSASAYADLSAVPVSEDAATYETPDPSVTEVHGEWYGPQKAGCERAALAARNGEVLVQRAGLLVGPHDPTDRFTYWAVRMRRSGPVLAPDVRDQPVQYLDARDLAEWTLRAADAGVTGVMNASGEPGRLTFGGVLAAAGPAEVRWIDEQQLLDAGVAPWTELPLWLPRRYGQDGLLQLDTTRARAAGLTTRPLEQTLADTVAWAEQHTTRVAADYGTRARSGVLSAEHERLLLAALGNRD